uniref:STI1 domain-containing protein n=1 Tax=Tetradesmus obliquus TaxID=3088 RepID=A0A383WNN6_TETOB
MHSWHAYSPGALWQHACFSSSAGTSSSSDKPSNSPSNSNSSSGSSEQVVDQLSSMMEVMMQDPAMQQLLLSRLPPHMQRPEVLRAMMANQEVRARIASIAQQSVSERHLPCAGQLQQQQQQ